MPIKVLVSGTGKMGRQVLAGICAEPGIEPAGVLAREAGEEYVALPDGGRVPLGADPAPFLARTKPDVVVDFTNAERTPAVARESLAAGARLVIGTSGLPDAFLDELRQECGRRKLGAVVAANFALGGVVMTHLAAIAARFFDSAEIIEMHHDGKADAPSGTAIATAQRMREARDGPLRRAPTQRQTLEGSRGAELDGISIHSVRLPGLLAHQEVIFGAPGQTLTLRHDTINRECFMPGVMMAIRGVMERDELVVGLESLLGIA